MSGSPREMKEKGREGGRIEGREDRRKGSKERKKSTLRKQYPFGEWVRTSKIKLRLNSQVHLGGGTTLLVKEERYTIQKVKSENLKELFEKWL